MILQNLLEKHLPFIYLFPPMCHLPHPYVSFTSPHVSFTSPLSVIYLTPMCHLPHPHVSFTSPPCVIYLTPMCHLPITKRGVLDLHKADTSDMETDSNRKTFAGDLCKSKYESCTSLARKH